MRFHRNIKENGLLGVMYWEYAGDTPEGDLSTVLAEEMLK
jgi:GH18 family chitinase